MRYFIVMGVVLSILCVSAMTAGIILKETALLVFSFVFILLLSYSLFSCLILLMVYKKRALKLSVSFLPRTISENTPYITARLREKAVFFSPPAILVRYMIILKTHDDKTIQHIFSKDFFTETTEKIEAKKRGVYFSSYDYIAICDIFGFFSFRVKITTEKQERIVIFPFEKAEQKLSAGITGNQQSEKNALFSGDNFIEQRKYVPGDDTRRINWKLFGHSEELFVREGEKSKISSLDLIIVCDTAIDKYAAIKKENAQNIADELCSRALFYAVSACAHSAKIVLYYRNGGAVENEEWLKLSWTPPENGQTEEALNDLRAMFAYPFAVEKKPGADLPLPNMENVNIIIVKDEK